MLATCEDELTLLQEKKDKGVNWRAGYHDLEKVYSKVISSHEFSMYSPAAYAYFALLYMLSSYTVVFKRRRLWAALLRCRWFSRDLFVGSLNVLPVPLLRRSETDTCVSM